MRLVWAVIPLVLFSIIGISESFAQESEFIASPKYQLESGILLEDIQCKDNRILVLRTNGNPACVTEKTAEKTGWKIIKTEFTKPNNIIPNKIIEEKYIANNKLVDFFDVKYPDFISLEEYDDRGYWILKNTNVKQLSRDDKTNLLKIPYDVCVEGLGDIVNNNALGANRIQKIIEENCGKEPDREEEMKKKWSSLSLYEKFATASYVYPRFYEYNHNQELWYLDSIQIRKISTDGESLLKERVEYSNRVIFDAFFDVIKAESKEIIVDDKPVKITKYVEVSRGWDRCYQTHAVIIDFVTEQETWQLDSRYRISCNMIEANTVVNDPIFTDIVNSFGIHGYKYNWDIDLSDSSILTI